MYHRIFLITLLALLAGCAANEPRSPTPAAVPLAVDTGNWPPPLGEVVLQTATSGGARPGEARPGEARPGEVMLDVGLVMFDAGIPEDAASHSRLGIFPDIRQAEAQYLPVLLRQALVDSGAWGVVRVLPRPDVSSELLVEGRILHSDGLRLVLEISARDASGQIWLERVYHDEAGEADYPVKPGDDPFADLYRAIANDLLARREQLAVSDYRRIRQVSLLRYAQGLSPEAFSGYLASGEDGRYRVQRLPAEDDPMVSRVQRIRNQEYLFIDTVDEQYTEQREQLAATYDLWRQYGREQALYREQYPQRVAERERHGSRGSFVAMEQAYNAYRSSKIQEQDLRELAAGFNNEVAPTVISTRGRVFRLEGSLESRYAEWREILQAIFALETGLPGG